jgi:hypothetical protein
MISPSSVSWWSKKMGRVAKPLQIEKRQYGALPLRARQDRLTAWSTSRQQGGR